jgi:hypothetical protein
MPPMGASLAVKGGSADRTRLPQNSKVPCSSSYRPARPSARVVPAASAASATPWPKA